MIDTKLITAVLTSCGWKPDDESWLEGWWVKGIHRVLGSQLLTSLDVCYRVFEKDAPDEYWVMLHWKVQKDSDNKAGFYATAKANERQRCEAWLKFKGVK